MLVGRIKGTRWLCDGGGDCLKYLKTGWNRKEEKGNKDFKKKTMLDQGVGASKRGGGLEHPYKLWLIARLECSF